MDYIKQILEKLDICYQNCYEDKFKTYFDILIAENEKYNLTAITQTEAVYEKHFFDSLAANAFFPLNSTVLDVGSGAGFPSIPLAIVRNDLSFVMIDSLKKRVDFLNTVIEKLSLKNAKALHLRAEDFKQKSCFDVVTSRAVAALPTLAEYTLPFVKKGGAFVAYKGLDYEAELEKAKNAIKVLGGKVGDILRFNLSDGATRAIIKIDKIASTPPIYPRGQNKPKTQPL